MESIIEKLKENNVCSISISEDKEIVTIEDACDYYFGVELSKEEIKTLCKELMDLIE